MDLAEQVACVLQRESLAGGRARGGESSQEQPPGLGAYPWGQGLHLELRVHFQMEHSQAGHGIWAGSLLFGASVSPRIQVSVG